MAGGWSSLPGDLLEEVLDHLSSDADHVHIHQVCNHWRASTSPLPVSRPWIVAGRSRRSGLVPLGEYSLWLPRGVRRMDVGAPAGLLYCCGTSRGWLALLDDDQSPTRLVLWEPLSNTEIPLPCLNPVTQVFLSDDPLTSSDWVVIAGQLKGEIRQKTLFWQPGDAAWSMLYELGTSAIDTVAFHGGKIYYIDMLRHVVICDLNIGTTSPPKCVWILHVCSVVIRLCRCDRDGLRPVRGAHLVTCNGDLLFVVLRWGSHLSLAEVYKPEWTPNQRLELCERVTDLGDYSLFVGKGDAFALSEKEFPAIKRNCVYLADRNYKQQYWISVFHLESGVLEEIPYPEELKKDRTNWTPYAWFCPRKPFLKQQGA